MKTIQQLFILLLLAAVMTACQDDPKDNPVLQEAFKIHKETIALHSGVMDQMKNLADVKEQVQQAMNQIQVRAEVMDTLTFSALQAAMGSLEGVEEGMENWAANLSEVPGFAHEHDHGDHEHGEEDHDEHGEEGHDHAHGADPKLTPEQILEVQKTHKSDLLKLKEEVESAMTVAKQLMSAI